MSEPVKEEKNGIEESVQEVKKDIKADKKNKPKKTLKQEILSWIYTILAAVAIALVIRTFLFEPIRVDGSSMRNTLVNNEIVLVTKPEYIFGDIERGDVVICRYPDRNSSSSINLGGSLEISLTSHTLFVKRVIAVPGDLLQIVNGVVYVNGEQVDESGIDKYSQDTSNYGPKRMGEDEYFVMGDNRASSNDSRYVGAISRDMIVGHVSRVLWPLSSFGQKVE